MTRRSKQSGSAAQAKLLAGEWLTWPEISTMQHYRGHIPRVWPGDDPGKYKYRAQFGLINRIPA